jgi:MFS-type transporter involved in bile tolerance (Atg22 family)
MNFFSLLTILFIGLKLTNYINWSWLIVLSPVLIPFSIVIGIIIYGIITVGISETLKIIKRN